MHPAAASAMADGALMGAFVSRVGVFPVPTRLLT
jgi:hypothetical protein